MTPETMARARAVPLWLALFLAAVGGVVLSAAFPSLGWWPLAFVGAGLLLVSLDGRGVWTALLTGLLGGFAFYGTLTFWLTTYLGPVPWLALAGLQSVFFAIASVLIALAWRWLPRAFPGVWARLIALPAALAGLWTLREAIASVWPYGGFSWGRLAFSQSESPVGDLVSWLGSSGLSFAIAFTAALLVQAIREVVAHRSRIGAVRVLPAAAASILLLMLPGWYVPVSDTVRVAAVQGNADAGLFAQRQRGDILADHLNATMPIINEKVDLIIWPENSADLNPLASSNAASVLDYVSESMDAPLIAGTIIAEDDGQTYNSMLLWQHGEGATARYDKAHPVPFAEYLPDREFWYPLAPSLFDLVPRDYTLGTRPNVFEIDGDTSFSAGLAICFDIVDDALLHQMIDGGAEIILAPTNNADFGHSDESVQQLAIARLRAMEFGRTVVNISTVGTSAIVAPDGSSIASLTPFEPGAMVEEVPLSTTITPAAIAGRWIEWAASGLGIALLALGIVVGIRRSRDDADA